MPCQHRICLGLLPDAQGSPPFTHFNFTIRPPKSEAGVLIDPGYIYPVSWGMNSGADQRIRVELIGPATPTKLPTLNAV